MKKALATILAAACLFTATACTGTSGNTKGELKNYDGDVSVPAGTDITYEIGEANAHLYDGVGYQWDKHMFTDTVALEEFDDSDFNTLLKYVDASRFHRIRIHVASEYFELKNDNDDPDVFQYDNQQPYNVNFYSPDMLALYKQLSACQKYGIRVTLSFTGMTRGSWNSDNSTAPKSNEEFAEGVSTMFQWLWKCGYTVCDELVIYPECEDLYHNKNNVFVFEEYEKTVRAVDAKLKRDGIRNKIKFTGPADNHNVNTLLTCVERLNDVYDCYSSSYYNFKNENSEEQMEAKLNERMPQITAAGKSYKYAEYNIAGTYASWEEIREQFESGLFLGRFFANSLNNGVTGMSFWTLADIPYGGIWMKTGQIKRDLESHEWKALPEWYAYTLISRYTRRDSKIYTLKDDKNFFETTALCSPNGNWTYVTANETDDDITISIVNKEANYPYAMRCYVYKEDTLPVENELRITDYTVINTYKRVMTIKVPANSMMVITNLPD